MREDILRERYYWKDPQGNPMEDWAGLCRRVARNLSNDVDEEEAFFNVMHEALFLPNSPALTNAGREAFTMSACFVLPIEDSVGAIFDTAKCAALVHKMGGGTGFGFSRLRPAGDTVGSTQGLASGPCSFLKIYNTSTEVMKQGGTRRGANMGMLRVDHPDIFEFVGLKERDGTINNFNLSVALTDEFMEAVEKDGDFDLRFDGKARRRVKARAIWDRIVEGGWRNGEPGVFFIDRANEANPTPRMGAFEGTNPCGEQPLLPFEACVLGSVNLSKMVSPEGTIDWDLLRSTVRTGTRMLDNIIDKQDYPLPQVEEMHKSNRKIGLGVMGWADMLIRLAIRYASQEALTLAEGVMSFITREAVEVSTELARIHGPFPQWEGSVWQQRGIKVRNATLTTIAPTGTLSIIARVNGGIEPVFDLKTVERRADVEYENTNLAYEEWQMAHQGEPLPGYFAEGERHIRGMAREDAGGFPEAYPQRHIEDHQFPKRSDREGGREGLPPCLRAGVQGAYRLSRRQQGEPDNLLRRRRLDHRRDGTDEDAGNKAPEGVGDRDVGGHGAHQRHYPRRQALRSIHHNPCGVEAFGGL